MHKWERRGTKDYWKCKVIPGRMRKNPYKDWWMSMHRGHTIKAGSWKLRGKNGCLEWICSTTTTFSSRPGKCDNILIAR